MTYSLKNCKVNLLPAERSFKNEVKHLEVERHETTAKKSWVEYIPLGVRKAFIGLTIVSLLCTSSPVYAQAPPQSVEVVQQQYKVEPSDGLKRMYAQYKNGALQEDVIRSRIAKEAAEYIKKNNLPPESFSDVVSTYWEALKKCEECSKECGVKPGSSKKAPSKKAKGAKSAAGEKGAKAREGAKSTEEKGQAKAGEEKKEVNGPKEITKEEYEKLIEKKLASEGAKNREDNKVVVIINKGQEQKENLPAPQQPEKEGAQPDVREIDAQKVNPNASDETQEEQENPSSEEQAENSSSEKNSEEKKTHAIITLPTFGEYRQMRNPYMDKVYKLGFESPLVLSVPIFRNFGLSVMGGYNGYWIKPIPEDSYSRQASLAGAGLYLRIKDLDVNALATMNGEFKRENLGALVLMNSDAFRLYLSTQFRKDKPTFLDMEYWNTKKPDSMIFQARASFYQMNDPSSTYQVSEVNTRLQVPLMESAFTPNLVLGYYYYNMNAGPLYKELSALPIGLSIKYRGLNVGAAWVPGYSNYRAIYPDDESTFGYKGNVYSGSVEKGSNYIDGFNVFANLNIVNVNGISLYLNTEYMQLGGKNRILLPSIGVKIEW